MSAEGPTRALPDGWVRPALTPESEPFFTSGELRLQRCRDCGGVQHPPVELCTRCPSFDLDTVAVRPVGTVVARTIVRHAANPALRDAVPYNVVVVALDEHPDVRITGNVTGIADDEVRIGLRVACEWVHLPADDGPDLRLPQWRPADPEEAP